MSITLKTNQIKLKIQNGNYQAPVVIADQTTSEHVAEVNTAITTTGNQQVSAIQTKGDEVLDSIPEDYTDLVEEVDELKSAVDEVETTLEMNDSTETVTGDQIVVPNVVVGENVTSISGAANISNGQILPTSMLNTSYVTGTTESFEFNKWGFAAVTQSNLNSILKPGKTYHISYDFELVSVLNQTVANREYGLLISDNILNPPYRSTAENHVNGFKFSVSQNFTVPNNGFSSSQSLFAYNGGNYNEDVCKITNLVISLADENPAWIEADNKTISSGQTIIAPYSTLYVDADNSITLQYVQSAEGNNRIDKLENSVEALDKDLESYKIRTNPIIRNICHRGLSTVAPEDTAPAYVAAKLAGFEYVENDLWFTSDGVPVMVHARDLSLVSDGVGNIDEVTYDYFKSLDFGQDNVYDGKYHGLKGLSFDEFIALCKQLGLKLYLDCKSFSPVPPGYNNGIEVCANILKKYSYTNNVTWICGDSGVTSVRNTLHDANVSYIIASAPTPADISFLSGYILADNPDATRFNLRADLITTAVTESVHDAGLKIDAWLSQIPPNPSVLINTVLKGIDGFTQDGANLDSIMTDYYRDMYSL